MPFVERFMAREVRCWVTDRQTHRQKDTHDNYSNPRCACTPRVNQGAPHALCCSCVNIAKVLPQNFPPNYKYICSHMITSLTYEIKSLNPTE